MSTRRRPPPPPPPPQYAPRPAPQLEPESVRAWCGVIEAVLDELATRGLEDDDRPRLALATLQLFHARGAAVAVPREEVREAIDAARDAAMSAPPGAAWLDAAFAMLHLARFALGEASEHATAAYLVSAWHRLGEPAEDARVRVEMAYEARLSLERSDAAGAG